MGPAAATTRTATMVAAAPISTTAAAVATAEPASDAVSELRAPALASGHAAAGTAGTAGATGTAAAAAAGSAAITGRMDTGWAWRMFKHQADEFYVTG